MVGGLNTARVREGPHQRIVHRCVRPADPLDQVDAAQELPELQVRGIRSCHEVHHFHRVGLGVPAGELVRDVAVHCSRGVIVQRALDGFVFVAVTAHGPGHVLPIGVLADDGTGGVPVYALKYFGGQVEQDLAVGDFHRAGGLVTEPEPRSGIHLDTAFKGCNAVAEPAVNGALRSGQGRHGKAVALRCGKVFRHHAPQQPLAAVRPPHSHRRHHMRQQLASVADVQVPAECPEGCHRNACAQSMRCDLPRLVDAGQHASVRAVHRHDLVHEFIAPAGVMESEAHGLDPVGSLFVAGRTLLCRPEPPDLILVCHVMLPLEPNE
ncbi:hypothetical protein D9M72_440290 [compost metagenome]